MDAMEQLTTLLAAAKKLNIKRLDQLKRKFCSETKFPLPQNSEILAAYKKMVATKKMQANQMLEHFLIKRKIRTLSGVAPIAVLTKPYPCPGKCAYCPNEKEMPKSYLSNEPAVMRAMRSNFDPYKQTALRIDALEAIGHVTDKIELIIMGGTFTHFPKKYQQWFVKRCFDACNQKTSANLKIAQKKNEKTQHRIIGLTLETRPDHINTKTIQQFRMLGCTKVEIGVQTLDNKILSLNKRGHTIEQVINATKLLKDAGFKVAYHWMPNLPGSTLRKDLLMYKKLFSDERFQLDMIKIYPTVVTKNCLLYKWWKQGKYKPYSQKTLFNLLLKMKLATPQYVRIIRLIRDIPAKSIEAGNKISNLRCTLQETLAKQGKQCSCIRCREARTNIANIHKAKLFFKKYRASDGIEYFIHYSSPNQKILYAFCRLRLNKTFVQDPLPALKNAAIIRELHTYGQTLAINQLNQQSAQHIGFGKKLMANVEKIAKENGYKQMAVISGIGVREYYKKLGYRIKGTYMVKQL
ncbi:tRNA uridine(34) 5-carboxymethylaminomethyl modification radical SAM/GNAT enzyme Elp3 [Candidatus Falkowbacteria bacterium]|nr:tRNA uridine(34) 5-carboxymethylaminomethyl modification radical SAM/GNAT enzyme Elp3 [Candidatus Falkowbacteria bacterium]